MVHMISARKSIFNFVINLLTKLVVGFSNPQSKFYIIPCNNAF